MEFDEDNVRPEEEVEDRLSKLPDEVIRNILSCIDMKFGVQTCLLSTRWRLVWTSIPCLNFSNLEFGCFPKFSEFVTNVLSKRNHQIQVSSINLLLFHIEACEDLVRKIANYAFYHNVQQLEVGGNCILRHELPSCLFSSQSLKHFALGNCSISPFITPTKPWDFPALTTLYLSDFILVSHKTTKDSLHDNIFTKCVNLKNLTLCWFNLVGGAEVFDIVAPRLSNLILIEGRNVKVVNVIAPQLENLTITDTSLKYLNAPSGVSSLCYKGYDPSLQLLSKDQFHSLNQVNICLDCYPHFENARKIINILQELSSASYLTLNVEIIECLSLFPDFLSHLPSPFGNLICLNIDSHMSEDSYKVRMCSATRNFLFDSSPNATFTMELPEETPGLAFMPTNWWRYVRKYTFKPSFAIVDDRHLLRKNKKDKKKKKKMKKTLSRMDAVMVIQMAFRAYVIRRSQALCALRELAVAKGEVLKDLLA